MSDQNLYIVYTSIYVNYIDPQNIIQHLLLPIPTILYNPHFGNPAHSNHIQEIYNQFINTIRTFDSRVDLNIYSWEFDIRFELINE